MTLSPKVRFGLWTLLLSVGTAMMGCKKGTPAPTQLLTSVRVGMVQMVDRGNVTRYSANIAPYSQVELAFRSSGYIQRIRQVRGADGRLRAIDEGDWVRKNTVMAMVQTQDYQAKIEQAKAQLANAHANAEHARLQFSRTSILYKAQSATKPDYDQAHAALQSAQAAVKAAEAELEQATIALNDCYLRAPFDGWIVQRNVDVGSLVGPATRGFVIADTHIVNAIFGVPDFAISQVRLGQREMITTQAVPGQFWGRVMAISPAADPKSRVYSVKVSIPNPRNLLRSGMIGSIAVGGQQLQRPVPALPLSAVISDPDHPQSFAVMVVESSGDTVTVHTRPVKLGGDTFGNLVVIRSGVTPGERVVTSGATYVRNGERVRIVS